MIRGFIELTRTYYVRRGNKIGKAWIVLNFKASWIKIAVLGMIGFRSVHNARQGIYNVAQNQLTIQVAPWFMLIDINIAFNS